MAEGALIIDIDSLFTQSDSPHTEFPTRLVTALSYVWGQYSEPRDKLLCNDGCAVDITANCRDALQIIRKRKTTGITTIWVDSICINQSDDTEKASQIPNMEEIYSWAEVVYVWLGQGNELSDRENGGFKASFKQAMAWHNQALVGIAEVVSTVRLRGDWFNRVWTFQELILAQDIVVMCGDYSLSWDRFLRGMHYIVSMKAKSDSLAVQLAPWHATLSLWMNIERRNTWRGHKMRTGRGERSSMTEYQVAWAVDTRIGRKVSRMIVTIVWLFPILLGVALSIHYLVRGNGLTSTNAQGLMLATGLCGVFAWAATILQILRAHQVAFPREMFSGFDPRREMLKVLPQAIKYRDATNPRDRAYAVYGILQNFDIPLSPVDYSKTEGHVFTNFYTDLL
ncbi:HET-domain-containing protein [Cadophora sp. DSE1049]|nr:HET-domain-containing protein [Cadophora sp. DSE1049]